MPIKPERDTTKKAEVLWMAWHPICGFCPDVYDLTRDALRRTMRACGFDGTSYQMVRVKVEEHSPNRKAKR